MGVGGRSPKGLSREDPYPRGSPRPGQNPPATGVHGWVTLLPDPPQLPTQPGEGGPPAHPLGVGVPGAHTPGDFSAPVPMVWGGSSLYTQETSVGLAVCSPRSAALGEPVHRAEAAVKGGGGRQPHS